MFVILSHELLNNQFPSLSYLGPTAWVKIKVNQIRKNIKNICHYMDTVSYMILTYVLSTIIDQKIIEFERLDFELCPFLHKYPK